MKPIDKEVATLSVFQKGLEQQRLPPGLDKIKVNKKAKQIWYLLNKDTKIQVKTAHGLTEEEKVGDCLGQGTAGAGLISAANLDQGLQKYFNESEEDNTNVLKIGNVRLQPIAY